MYRNQTAMCFLLCTLSLSLACQKKSGTDDERVAAITEAEKAEAEKQAALNNSDTAQQIDLVDEYEALQDGIFADSTLLAAITGCQAKAPTDGGSTWVYDPIDGCMQQQTNTNKQNCSTAQWSDLLGCVPLAPPGDTRSPLEIACKANPNLYWIDTCDSTKDSTGQCATPGICYRARDLTADQCATAALSFYNNTCFANSAEVDCFKEGNYWFTGTSTSQNCRTVAQLSEPFCQLYDPALSWDKSTAPPACTRSSTGLVLTQIGVKTDTLTALVLGTPVCLAGEIPTETTCAAGGPNLAQFGPPAVRTIANNNPSVLTCPAMTTSFTVKMAFPEYCIDGLGYEEIPEIDVACGANSTSFTKTYPSAYANVLKKAETPTYAFSYHKNCGFDDSSPHPFSTFCSFPTYTAGTNNTHRTASCNQQNFTRFTNTITCSPPLGVGLFQYTVKFSTGTLSSWGAWAPVLGCRAAGSTSGTAGQFCSGCNPMTGTIPTLNPPNSRATVPILALQTPAGTSAAPSQTIVSCNSGDYVHGFDQNGGIQCSTYSIYKNMPQCHSMATRSPTLSSDPNNNYPCVYTQSALIANSGANQITTTPMVGAPDTRVATSTKCSMNQIQSFFADSSAGVGSAFGIQCAGSTTKIPFGNKEALLNSGFSCLAPYTFSLDVYSSDTEKQIVGYEMKCSNNTSVTRGETGGGGASTLSCAGAGTPANPAYPVGVAVKQTATAVTQLGLICGQWIMPAN